VLPGYRGDAEAEVVGGLHAGDEVVLYLSDEVGDGVRVRGSRPEPQGKDMNDLALNISSGHVQPFLWVGAS
jgi:hypothetical protein